jgi:catechol 2,3-dioxygenase-like lactoylglutathione lyase family enzyme
MINGAHFLLYTKDPDADRAFLRDVLQFRSVDVGHGWLIFALPPAELAVHPSSGNVTQDDAGHPLLGAAVYLMCDDLQAEIASLKAKNVVCSDVVNAGWGIKTTFALPSGGEIGLYQPRHARP